MSFPTIYFRISSFFTINKTLLFSFFIILFPWKYIMKRPKWDDFEVTAEYYSRVFNTKIEIYNLDSFMGFLSFEVIWDALLLWLTSVFGEPEIALRIISFFILFVWGIYLFRRMPIYWALLFLLNPSSIDISMSIVRNGFAWALIICGMYLISNRLIKYTLYIISPFIHISSLGILGLLFVSTKIKNVTNSKNMSIILVGLTGIILGLSVTVFSQALNYILNDARFSVGYARGGGSFLQMIFFIILLITQLSCGKNYVRENLFVIGILFWYLTMNPFIPWSHRMWSAIIPLIGYSIWTLPGKKRQFILFLWVGNFFLWYLYWSKLFDLWYPA